MTARDDHVAAVDASLAALAEWVDMIMVAYTKGLAVRELVADSTNPFKAGAITAWHSCDEAIGSLHAAEIALTKANESLVSYRERLG